MPAIAVEGLWKQYRYGQLGYGTLRHDLQSWWARMRGRPDPNSALEETRKNEGGGSDPDRFWALRDVSFRVEPGEVVGIIGRNGAGKSTLLKVMSRVTSPSRGSIRLQGRIASLLEVGTGFHPDLTGRENVFLNGAVLGMTRAEVTAKFDEIVAFADVERFIDTPVKRYSSGMHVRLAFAVAAHLEIDILVVDEVLSVGDAAFQKKCLGKMGDVAQSGRTILFVSHNLGALANLCRRSILLSSGALVADGPTEAVVHEYLSSGDGNTAERVWSEPETAPGNDRVRIRAVRARSEGAAGSNLPIDREVHIEVEFWNRREGLELNTSIHLLDQVGVTVLATANLPSATAGLDPMTGEKFQEGLYRSRCTIPANFLNDATYTVSAIVLSSVTRWEAAAKEVVSFTVFDTGDMKKEYGGGWVGVVRPRLKWSTEPVAYAEEEG